MKTQNTVFLSWSFAAVGVLCLMGCSGGTDSATPSDEYDVLERAIFEKMIEAHPDALELERSIHGSYADVSILKQRRFESMVGGRFFATVKIGDVFLDDHGNSAMSARPEGSSVQSLILRDPSSLLEQLAEKGELKRFRKAVVLFDLKSVGRFKVALDFLPVGHEEELDVDIESRIDGDPVIVGKLLLIAPLTPERTSEFNTGKPAATNFHRVQDADSPSH